MNIINTTLKLFETNTSETVTIAIVAFILGLILQCLFCKLFCRPCKSAKKCAPKKSAPKAENKVFEKRKPHPAPADGSVEIYIGNLSYDTTEQQIQELFAKYGAVKNVRLVTNRYNGKSKGFGFIQMPVRAEAEKACQELNDKEFMGRQIKCNEAKNTI